MDFNRLYRFEFLKEAPAYPVGTDMDLARTVASRMSDALDYVYKSKDYPINLWCSGSSGTILCSLISSLNSRVGRIRYVKKNNEYTHGSGCIYNISSNSYEVIVDDFISSGETITRIYGHYSKSVLGAVHKFPISLMVTGYVHDMSTDEMVFDKVMAFSFCSKLELKESIRGHINNCLTKETLNL